MVFPSGSWRVGLCWIILVASPESHWGYWVEEKIAYRVTSQRNRNGIAMIMKKKRATAGKTDNRACKISTQADSWIVPGQEMITLVGAHLEVVVDRAETTEEGGSIKTLV